MRRARSAWRVPDALLACCCGLAALAQVNGYYVFVLANVALLAHRRHRPQRAARADRPGVVRPRRLLRDRRLHGRDPHHQGTAGASGWPGRWRRCWPACVGALLALPALRVRGPYLAMITIAFGFIVEHGIVEMRAPHRRAERHHGHRRAVAGRPGAGRARGGACWRMRWQRRARSPAYAWLSRGTWGAAMRAVRDSETAAESVGLDPLAIKTVAFAVSAAVRRRGRRPVRAAVGLRHAAHLRLPAVDPVRAGGDDRRRRLRRRARWSARWSSACCPKRWRSFEEYRLLFFGALLLVVLWVAPDGVVGLLRGACAPLAAGDGACRSPTTRRAAARALRDAPAARPGGAGLGMQFGGVRAVDDLSLRRRRRPHHQPDRPQRRRQDHGAQHAERLLPRQRRRRSRSGAQALAGPAAPAASRAPASRAPTRPRSCSAA